MPIQLPRYSAQSLPREEVLSPEEAARAAQTSALFVSEVSGAVADFTRQLFLAEQESLADRAIAEAEHRAAQFLSGPEWDWDREPDELDEQGNVITRGRPTEEVKAEQWSQSMSGFTDSINQIRNPAARSRAQQEINSITMKAQLAAQEKIDKLVLRRTKNNTYDAVEMEQSLGNFDRAADLIRMSADRGVLSPAERKAALADNRDKRSKAPYLAALATRNPSVIEQAAIDVLEDENIADPNARMSLYKSLIVEHERLTNDTDPDPALERNYLRLLEPAIDGSLTINGVIQQRENLSKTRFDNLVMIIRSRSEASAKGDRTNSAGYDAIENEIRDLLVWKSRDETSNFAQDAQDAKNRLSADANIGIDDLTRAHQRIDAQISALRQNPHWKQLLNVERAAMTGITGTGMFQLQTDNNIEALAYEQLELDFWSAAERYGTDFEAERWLDVNRYPYRKMALSKQVTEAGWEIVDLPDGSGPDIPATRSSIMSTLEARKKSVRYAPTLETTEQQQAWVGKQYRLLQTVTGQSQ